MAADNVEQFGGARGTGRCSGGGAEPSAGCPFPVTLDKLEVCFDSLVGTAVTGKETMDGLVKSEATLAKAIADLTETNSRLAKKVEHQTAELKKRGGGGVEDSGRAETGGINEGSYCANYKRTTWNTPDN